MKDQRAYLTLTAGPSRLGTIRLILRSTVVPRTVHNFASLLSQPAPDGYRGSAFHRLIPGFMAQGGDFTNADGTGGKSIYGETFPDENFSLRHGGRGTLSMANSGPDTNGSQFFVSFRATPHLDGKHVVFGHVDLSDDESLRVLDALESIKTGTRDMPVLKVKIAECGVEDDKVKGEGTEVGQEISQIADDDEIDIDEEEDDVGDVPLALAKSPLATDALNKTVGKDEIELSEEDADADHTKPKSKKDALKDRLRKLKMKMNQSRTLNRREVQLEGERLGSEEGALRDRRRQKKDDREQYEKEWARANGRALSLGSDARVAVADTKLMAQSAADSLRKANRKAEKARANRFEANDYYNPEGQHRNYERSLKSLPGGMSRFEATTATFNPIDDGQHHDNYVGEEQGAKRLANELKRRAERAASRKRDRMEFDAADVSGISARNNRFNEKIGRNFDKHTAEIRQNLERGTAL